MRLTKRKLKFNKFKTKFQKNLKSNLNHWKNLNLILAIAINYKFNKSNLILKILLLMKKIYNLSFCPLL